MQHENIFKISEEDLISFVKHSSPLKNFSLSSKTDKFLLHKLATLLPARSVVVEIGSYLGASMAIMAHANSELDIHGYDTFDQGKYSRNQDQLFEQSIGHKIRTLDNVKEFLKNYTNIQLEKVNGSIKFDKSIDLFIEDSSHRNPQLYNSLSYWLPKVKVGGLVLIHDYRPWKELGSNDRFLDVEKEVKRLSKDENWIFFGALQSELFEEPGSHAILKKIK